ncbi:hypothetical protein BAE44_0020102, partial [Dichanthelium oligosanthes]
LALATPACMIKRRAVRGAPAHVASHPDTRPSTTRVNQQRRHALVLLEPSATKPASAGRLPACLPAAAAHGLDADPTSFRYNTIDPQLSISRLAGT